LKSVASLLAERIAPDRSTETLRGSRAIRASGKGGAPTPSRK
jgi:hypothetical protein